MADDDDDEVIACSIRYYSAVLIKGSKQYEYKVLPTEETTVQCVQHVTTRLIKLSQYVCRKRHNL